METLAYVHMALEYEKTLPIAADSEKLVDRQLEKNQNCYYQNWWSFKLFKWLPPKENHKLVNH